jgi:hypothetical protein
MVSFLLGAIRGGQLILPRSTPSGSTCTRARARDHRLIAPGCRPRTPRNGPSRPLQRDVPNCSVSTFTAPCVARSSSLTTWAFGHPWPRAPVARSAFFDALRAFFFSRLQVGRRAATGLSTRTALHRPSGLDGPAVGGGETTPLDNLTRRRLPFRKHGRRVCERARKARGEGGAGSRSSGRPHAPFSRPRPSVVDRRPLDGGHGRKLPGSRLPIGCRADLEE